MIPIIKNIHRGPADYLESAIVHEQNIRPSRKSDRWGVFLVAFGGQLYQLANQTAHVFHSRSDPYISPSRIISFSSSGRKIDLIDSPAKVNYPALNEMDNGDENGDAKDDDDDEDELEEDEELDGDEGDEDDEEGDDGRDKQGLAGEKYEGDDHNGVGEDEEESDSGSDEDEADTEEDEFEEDEEEFDDDEYSLEDDEDDDDEYDEDTV